VLILAVVAAPDADTLHMLFGNLLAVSVSHAVGLAMVALVIGLAHMLFSQRFLLVTFDAEGAQVAGVRARLWSLGLNLLVGVTAAAAVREIGALLTFETLGDGQSRCEDLALEGGNILRSDQFVSCPGPS
jgi:ABC-type Mn2+/Zn2+ transport system permease subunit